MKKELSLRLSTGQQRLTTIYEFVEGNYVINSDISRDIIKTIQQIYGDKLDEEGRKLVKKLNNKGTIRLKYSDLPAVVRGNFEGFNISVTKITDSTQEEITEYFRFVQNQERLRAGEILNSLSDCKMEKYLDQINDIEKFIRIIGFDNERKEFDKLFYGIIGVLDNKISLGMPDKIINRFVTTVEELTVGKQEVENLIKQINEITQICDETILYRTKKRYIKFLMLLMGFQLVDFSKDTKKKLIALETIDNKLSVFFSSKPNIVEKEFNGYTRDVIEEYRSIALISKGAQILERVENRMKILAYYIENIEVKDKTSGYEII